MTVEAPHFFVLTFAPGAPFSTTLLSQRSLQFSAKPQSTMPAEEKQIVFVSEDPSSRARKMLGCLYTSLFLSAGIIALSLLHLGILSLLVAPITGFLTLIFSVSLIALTHKDFARRRRGFPTPTDPGKDRHTWLLRICRAPSMASTWFLAVLWIAGLGIQANILSDMALANLGPVNIDGNTFRERVQGIETSVAIGGAEAALMGVQMLVLVVLSIMAMMERTSVTRQIWLGKPYEA
ncbi:hypothetical protein FA15DRAFT_674095 [Coprinopsis marcescibilis]|uniref:Uncharacterized protein n=1 Tax=Coprinopsis marcescibilis TaxID=230819 RepID=A0A5C3KIV7_COPMA|nr:hypothetical protein FA15DRAFT_674095 [Coprinopsis marcescibilis]